MLMKIVSASLSYLGEVSVRTEGAGTENNNSPADAGLLTFIHGSGLDYLLVILPPTAAATISVVEIAGLVFAGLGNVDGDCTAHKILAVEHADGLLGFFRCGEFHKAEAFCAA